MDSVTHFEVPVDNIERAKKFYQETFGWKINDIPNMPYWMAYTCEVDEKFMATEPNKINGGFYKRGGEESPHPSIVLSVKNINASLEKVISNGGSITMNQRQVGNMGLYAQVKDSEGNIIGIWETLKKPNPSEVPIS